MRYFVSRTRALGTYSRLAAFISVLADRKDQTMDWSRVEGNWKEAKGKIKEKWGKLTDDDLTAINR
jgi:hypothetical protein